MGLLDFPVHEELHEEPLFYIEPKDRDPASEDDRQREMVANLRRAGIFVAHIPQSGRRSDYERVTLHRNGAVSGIPDLMILFRGGQYFAEVKDGRGKPSRPQIEVMNQMTRMGVPCGVHRSWDSLAARLAALGAPVALKSEAQSIGNIARNLILHLIDAESDPADRKAKIMMAREDGLLSDAETSLLISQNGLEEA